jgi:hypothetical protein
MSRKMQIRLGGLGTALLASLALAPLAQALPDPIGQTLDKPSGTTQGYAVRPPDRSDGLGRGPQVTTGVVAVPDRADGLGTAGGPRAVPTSVVFTSDNSFGWIDALVGAVAAFAAVLLAGLGVIITRRHGGVAQPS